MSLPIREKILQKIIILLKAFEQNNSLGFDGVTVLRNRSILNENEVPALCLWDNQAEYRDKNYQTEQRVMPLKIDFLNVVNTSVDASQTANLYAAEIERHVMQYDLEFQALIDSIACTGLEIGVLESGSTTLGVSLFFNVTFSTVKGDPYSGVNYA